MVAEVEAVEEDDADVEVVERAAEPGRELRARERDEPARTLLRNRTLPRPGGQRIEGPVVLAGRDPDRDRLKRAGVERITARGVGKLGSASSWPSTLRARNRGTRMRRPPSVTSPRALPPRTARRVGLGACFGPQSCSRSCSIIVRSTCWPASRQSPKNAVRVSARTSSSGNGTCTVATGGDVRASPASDPVRLFFMGGSFRMVVVTTVLPDGEGAAAPFSARQFNRRRDIPR